MCMSGECGMHVIEIYVPVADGHTSQSFIGLGEYESLIQVELQVNAKLI